MLLLSTILLAATISTTDNREFFPNLTSRWPTAVSEYATPGSAAFDYDKRIAVTNAAALYAIFNAYYERLYYFNQGSYISSELTPENFDFQAHSGGTGYIADLNRLSTPDDSLTALANMSRIGNVFLKQTTLADDFDMYVSEWGLPLDSWVSSSRIKKLDSGEWVDLDTDLPSFGWRRLIVGSEGGPTQYMRSLDDFNPDMIFRRTSRNDAPAAFIWSYLGYGDQLNNDLSYQCTTATNDTTFTEAVQHYFTGKTNGFFNVRNPTNVLQSTQDWMSSMGRALSLIDRFYTSYEIPVAIKGEGTTYELYRLSTYTENMSGRSITVAPGGNGTFSTPITINRGAWTVGQLETNIHEHVTNTNVWQHAYEFNISGTTFKRGVAGIVTLPVFEYSINVGDTAMYLLAETAVAGKTMEIYAFDRENSVYMYGCDTNSPSQVFLVYTFTIDEGTFNLNGMLEANQNASRSYGCNETFLDYGPEGYGMYFRVGAKSADNVPPCVGFLSSLVNDRNSDWVGGELPSGAADYPFAQLRYCSAIGSGAGESLTNFVWYCKSEMQSHVLSSARGRWGDWTDPVNYSTLTAYEASYPAVSSNAMVVAASRATYDADAYLITFNDDSEVIKLASRKGTNYTEIAEPPSLNLDLYQVEHVVTPLFQYDKSGDADEKNAHRAVADGYITQRITYDFDSLKLSDE